MAPVQTNPHVFFDVYFGKQKAGRIIIELYQNVVPKTVKNFLALCVGDVKQGDKKLHYKGTKFHRVVPQFLVQGGNVGGSSLGGDSIYGPTFEDENFNLLHDCEGAVGMANNGPNTNGSQFYITTVPCPHLDGVNVVFGKVVKGLNIVVEMGDLPRHQDEPIEDIVIVDCGEIKSGEPFSIEESDGTEDVFPPWPNDWEVSSSNVNVVKDAVEKIKSSGAHYFYKGNYLDAERKYKKALRYIDWYLHENVADAGNEEINKMRLTIILNLATTKHKLDKHKEVVHLCTQVIQKDPDNGKAYYRRAQARLCIKDYDKALNDINTAITLHPNDKKIQDFLDLTKKTKLNYLKQEKKVFSKLFK